MTSIIDTSFIVGLLNRDDRNHQRIVHAAGRLRTTPWFPSAGMAEVCFMLQRRVGVGAVAEFVATIGQPEASFALLEATPPDYRRAAEVIVQYGDSGLDFVDAVIVAVAERLNIGTILTLDHRHFGIVRPRHRAAFELLPEVV